MRSQAILLFALIAQSALTLVALAPVARAEPARTPAQALIKAYPDALDRFENGVLIWRDGARMPVSDGVANKSFDAMLDAPDLDDMFAVPYPKGDQSAPPSSDPGRVRNAAFFSKMYGDCGRGEVDAKLVSVPWVPAFGGGALRVTTVNGVDRKVAAISEELSRLPPDTVRTYLVPSAGAYVCRPIAGTGRASPHGYGIAIDIALRRSDYWRWGDRRSYRNRIPPEIVAIFERHGFIWGGKWQSFDTMHFEYRPELLGAPKAGN